MRSKTLRLSAALLVLLQLPGSLLAQGDEPDHPGYSAAECPDCAEWNAATPPAHLFGNVYYVGPRGLSAILVTSPTGHVLLDAGLPESAAPIMASIRGLGFRVEDIRLIVTSHTHYDHAGGVAAIQRASGAVVAASPASARVLRRGASGPDDPQFGLLLPFPPVDGARLRELKDGDTVQVGPVTLKAHFTPGHTPGGTSWSWRSCNENECLDFVYADSQSPISDDDFLFTGSPRYPDVLRDFEQGIALLAQLPCDVLLTPHPAASQLWQRLEAQARGTTPGLRDPEACRRYAANAHQQLDRRVARERGEP